MTFVLWSATRRSLAAKKATGLASRKL
jgi:hypothetical protein